MDLFKDMSWTQAKINQNNAKKLSQYRTKYYKHILRIFNVHHKQTKYLNTTKPYAPKKQSVQSTGNDLLIKFKGTYLHV